MSDRLSVETLFDMATRAPSPCDDLRTGIKVLSDAYWSRDDLPSDLRDRIRDWIDGAIKLMYVRGEG